MSGRWVSLRPSQERETRRVFGEWPSLIDRDATHKCEIRFAPLTWKAPLLPPMLEGVADNVAPGVDFGLFPNRARQVRRAYTVKRMAEAVSRSSLVKTRRPPCGSPVGRGSSGSAVGAGRF